MILNLDINIDYALLKCVVHITCAYESDDKPQKTENSLRFLWKTVEMLD